MAKVPCTQEEIFLFVLDSRDGDVSEMRFKESNLRWGVDIFTPYTCV